MPSVMHKTMLLDAAALNTFLLEILLHSVKPLHHLRREDLSVELILIVQEVLLASLRNA
jgi:hypothetical protein